MIHHTDLKKLLIFILLLKFLDVLTSYIGMSQNFVETNPLPYFFLSGFIFMILLIVILFNFELLYNKTTDKQRRISYMCFKTVIYFQLLFIFNNLFIIFVLQ